MRSPAEGELAMHVAIPLGQGQVFNGSHLAVSWGQVVAIPLGQGQVFNLR